MGRSTAQAQTDFDAVFAKTTVTSATVTQAFNDLSKAITDSGVTTADLTTVAADRAAIQKDLTGLPSGSVPPIGPGQPIGPAQSVGWTVLGGGPIWSDVIVAGSGGVGINPIVVGSFGAGTLPNALDFTFGGPGAAPWRGPWLRPAW